MKTNSGKKGEGMPVVRNPQFYFREGLCWSDINTTFLKCRKKQKSINDVKSMSVYSNCELTPNDLIIGIINSTLISYYVDTFVNNTQTFQINDARQLPIVIPSSSILESICGITKLGVECKINKPQNEEDKLYYIQSNLDKVINELYGIN